MRVLMTVYILVYGAVPIYVLVVPCVGCKMYITVAIKSMNEYNRPTAVRTRH